MAGLVRCGSMRTLLRTLLRTVLVQPNDATNATTSNIHHNIMNILKIIVAPPNATRCYNVLQIAVFTLVSS